jgi:hypothetical protein
VKREQRINVSLSANFDVSFATTPFVVGRFIAVLGEHPSNAAKSADYEREVIQQWPLFDRT